MDEQGRPEEVLRLVLMAFDDVPDDVQGAPELPAWDCDVGEPVVLRLPLRDVAVPVRVLLDELFLITSGSIRGSLRVS